MLPAPGRFSTTNCWPSVLASRGEIKRARTSAVEPAPKPTMIRTGREGYCCARVENTIANSNRPATSQPPATSNTALSMVPRGLAFFCAGTIVRRTKRIDKPGEGGRPPISELPRNPKGPAQAGPPEQGFRSALRHDGRRSFAFAHPNAAGHAYRHESGNQRKQKLFHCNPLCCCPWLIERECTTNPYCFSSA
jgi:hypothetical protein